MKCDELQLLQGPYLDSELDAKTSLEVQQHLKSCADCARLFAEEQKLEARIKAGLNQGSRTTSLWEQIERPVVAAAPSAAHSRVPIRAAQPAGWQAFLSTLGQRLQAACRRAPRAWAGLAAVWAVILVLNCTAREPDVRLATDQGVPSALEMRFAWRQKQMLMADLAVLSEPAPAAKAKAAPPSPHSERRQNTLNT